MAQDPMVAAAAFIDLADEAMRILTPEENAEAARFAAKVKDALEGTTNGRVGIAALFKAIVLFGEVILDTPREGYSGLIN